MHTAKIYTVYNTVKDWDLRQIAQDHIDVMLDAYEQGLLDSHLAGVKICTKNSTMPNNNLNMVRTYEPKTFL